MMTQLDYTPARSLNPSGDGLEHPQLRRGEAQVKVVDAEGKIVPVNSRGELCTRGPHVFKGYLNDDAKTKEAIRDGWYHTGCGSRVVQCLVQCGDAHRNAYGARDPDILDVSARHLAATTSPPVIFLPVAAELTENHKEQERTKRGPPTEAMATKRSSAAESVGAKTGGTAVNCNPALKDDASAAATTRATEQNTPNEATAPRPGFDFKEDMDTDATDVERQIEDLEAVTGEL
ncbi:hypothetical protein HPB47_017452 [Ixodes persulcatus]|uniref:Uncharacterized protein n=1 Tax=Ixodes persulcatus TaxID=34615 RepID=A0AC60QN99_IXOPE|nr:hypothetical protein HPB47_017452 [Ixodes persulcatus]